MYRITCSVATRSVCKFMYNDNLLIVLINSFNYTFYMKLNSLS